MLSTITLDQMEIICTFMPEQFFTENHHTAWGAALDYEGHKEVRAFFIDNALYWLEEFNFDGLRFDAVSAIKDDSAPHFLVELAQRIRAYFADERPRHLMLENEKNQAIYLERKDGQPELYDAQWNDDIHHAYHVIATGESGGWYVDYQPNDIADTTIALLGRALSVRDLFIKAKCQLIKKAIHAVPRARIYLHLVLFLIFKTMTKLATEP